MALLALGACDRTAGSLPNAGTRDGRIAILRQIADKCHLPARTFRLIGMDELHFQPSPDARYEDVACALAELKKSPFPMKMGFVGNEAFWEPGNSQ